MPASRRRALIFGLALLLMAALWPTTRVSAEVPWLMRVTCRDDATFTRLVTAGMRVLLWWDGKAYVMADSAQRELLDTEGYASELLGTHPSQGEYLVIWEFDDAAQVLRWRYGTVEPLGDGYYLLGLPVGVELGIDEGPRYAQHLPYSMAAPRPPSPAVLNPPAPPPLLARIVDSVSEERLAQDIAELGDDDDAPGMDTLRSRFTKAPGLVAEAGYIARQLSAAGLAVSYFPFSYGQTVQNVIGTLPGRRPESEGFFIVCAHYDSTGAVSAGWKTDWASMPAPGADDNGSGTAAVLEVARALAHQSLAYTIRFCFFAGEEQGLYGSQAYAQAQQAAGANILGVINLDMIGYDGNGDGLFEVHTGCTAASQALGQVLVRNARRFAPALQPKVITDKAGWGSDQAPFWRAGYPALQLIEDRDWDFNPRYHQTNDVLSVLDTGYCTGIARAVAGAAGELAQLQGPDLRASARAAFGRPLPGNMCFTIALHNAGAGPSRVALTDVLPPGLVLSGPIIASQGKATWDAPQRRLHWASTLVPGGAVTIAFRTLVEPAVPSGAWITNTVQVDDGAGWVQSLPVAAQVLWRPMLPPIVKGP